MPVEVILPKVDMDMATGQIARWFVSEGAAVNKGQTLFEIETDKAAMEIDAPASGIIRDITGKERVDIPVGQAVAWIYADGEAAGTGVAATPESPASPPPSVPADGNQPTEDGHLENSSLPPDSAGEGRGVERRDDAVRATPLARRLAREAGLDLAAIAGSGPNGRIVRADVETALRRPPSVPSEQRSDTVLALFDPASYTLVPHDSMRRTIARRLVESKSTIPHFYLTADCTLDALLALRAELNAAAPSRDGKPAYKLSVNDMVAKAWALALRDVPDANVSWTEAHLVRHAEVDVGVAVSVPGGLITPIVRRAQDKTLSVISGEMRDLAGRARDRKLLPDEYRGGTTAVSNLGMFGIRQFSAVINPPHATILAVGAGEQRAVVKGGSVAVATVMSVTLSADHRAVDGALAAELLSAFRAIVERPLRMLA